MRMRLLYLTVSLLLLACKGDESAVDTAADYKQRMRDFVIGISQYAKAARPGFLIVPQNGIELVTMDGSETGKPDMAYLGAIDGNGQEDLFYGYDNDDQATPAAITSYLEALLNTAKLAGKVILATDYCSTSAKMADSYVQNKKRGYVSFAANHRGLDDIPNFPIKIHQENNAAVTNLAQVKNFLYLINPAEFSAKSALIEAVAATNYDLIIMDLDFNGGRTFTSAEINQLKSKANGGKRLVICYLSIGEAENYRYYWQTDWNKKKPVWLDSENPDWAGNYKVKYWNSDWQRIIYGNDDSYLRKIISADFDGVYLDIIDAFEYYEK